MKISKRYYFAAFLVLAAALIKVFLYHIYVPPILMYHSFDGKYNDTKLSVCPASFQKQMEFLHRHSYNVIPLREMAAMIKEGKRVPGKTVSITMDDGFMNNYLCAYPVLKKYAFPATIFIPVEFVGKEGFMGWKELKDISDNNITVGSHSKSHIWLPTLSKKDLVGELRGSRQTLSKGIGKEVTLLAYPLGAYDERVKKIAMATGYEAAVSTNPGPGRRWDDVFALKRIRISRTSDNMFAFWLAASGYYTFIKETRDSE